MPDFLGVSHVDLTVRDVQASAEWYRTVFGLETLFETKEEVRSAVVMIHPDTHLAICVGSHVANDGQPFDEARTGLDHLSLRGADPAAREAWAAHLDDLGIEHSPIADEPYGSVLVFRDPDNIQLELFVNP
jgi:glyoxylase I family protein